MKTLTIMLTVIFLLGCVMQTSTIEEINHSEEITKDIKPQNESIAINEKIPDYNTEIKLNESAAQKATEKEEVQETRAYPSFENLKQRLRESGIDCNSEIHQFATEETLVIDPNDSDILYVAVAGKGLYKSIDRGATWSKKTNGIFAYPKMDNKNEPCYWVMGKIVIDQKNSKHLLLVPSDTTSGTPYQPYSESAGIWETLDGGESWHQLLEGDINAGGRGGIAFDPANSQIIYYGVDSDRASYREAGSNLTFNSIGILYKSTDGGKNWEELPTGVYEGLQAVAIFVNPKNSNELFVITQNHNHIYTQSSTIEVPAQQRFGPIKSTDGGNTWTSLVNSLPPDYGILLDGDVSKHNFNNIILRPFLFGQDVPSGVEQKSYYSLDGGKTFQRTGVYIDVGRYEPYDTNGNHLLGSSPFLENGKIVESNNGGVTWNTISDIPETNGKRWYISNFVWDPLDRDTVYINGNHGQVWRSKNGGKTWENVLDFNKLN